MGLNHPLISVIVPIYNVERYVRRCLDSLRVQTIREIEVICIDDGSTDKSGIIADEYESSEFPIFRVIHTENRGLSAARNRGIDESKSNWLMFVDSDDWVSEDFCKVPYEKNIEYEADMVIFERYRVSRFGNIKKPRKRNAPIGIVDELIAHECGGAAAWNKMYRKSLFDNIRYPEGHVYEDVAITHKIVHLSEKILIIQDCLYYHAYRKGSISQEHSSDKSRDSFISAYERYNDLKEWGCPEEKLKPKICSAALGFMAYSSYSKDLLHLKAEEIINSTNSFPKTYPVLKKIALKVCKIDKNMFYFVSKVVAYIRK